MKKNCSESLVFSAFFLATLLVMSLFFAPAKGDTVFKPSWSSGFPSDKPDPIFKKKAYRWLEADGRLLETIFIFTDELLKEALESFGVQSVHRNNTSFLLRGGYKVVDRRHSIDRGSGQLTEHIRLCIDYNAVFLKFKEKMKSYAEGIATAVSLQTDKDPLLSFLTFVQQIPYRQPPDIFHKRYINGFFVPPLCLSEGYGDCDSKAVLLADLLTSRHQQEGRLGLALIDGKGVAHSILLIQRPQLPGMSSIYADNYGRFLPVETTAPGWNPGFLSPILVDLLKEGQFRFVPFE